MARLGAGDGDWELQGEFGGEGGRGAGENEDLVGGSGLGGGYSGGHVVYGAEGYGVEVAGRRERFGTIGPDFNVF
jgi:hypothetical protein